MNFNGSSSEGSRQVRVRFLTKMPPPLRAPTSAIAVPSNLTRMGLSEIVNLLLKNGIFVFFVFFLILSSLLELWWILLLIDVAKMNLYEIRER